MFILGFVAGALALACLLTYLACRDGWLVGFGVALFGWIFLGASAFAADTTVSVLPWYQLAEPYILAAFSAVLSILLGWLVLLIQKKTGLQIDQHARDIVQQAAVNAAGRVLASQEGNIATLKFDVHSPAIAAEVPKLQQSVGASLNKLGITPQRTAELITGKVGQLQAAATVTPVAITQAKQVTL